MNDESPNNIKNNNLLGSLNNFQSNSKSIEINELEVFNKIKDKSLSDMLK